MHRKRSTRSAALVAAAAAFSAVAGHRATELLAFRHALAAGAYGHHAHTAVLPVSLAAVLLATLGAAFAVSERAGVPLGLRCGPAAAAGAVLRLDARLHLIVALLSQLTVLAVMENAEEFGAHGTLCGGLEWLGPAPAVTFALHAAIAVLVTLLLRRSLAALLHSCDRLVIAVAAASRSVPARSRACFMARPRRRRITLSRFAPLASHTGLRAPPLLS